MARTRNLILSLLVGGAGLALPAGATFFVDPAGNDANDCQSAATACQTIQAAIDKAPDGETIKIAAGTYAEALSISNRDSLALEGGANVSITDPGLLLGDAVVNINDSRRIQLLELTVAGNPAGVEALRIFDSGTISLDRCVIRDANLGLFLNTAHVNISDSWIRDNGIGVRVDRGSTVALNSTPFSSAVTTVEGNNTGVFVREGSVRLHGATVLQDNGYAVSSEGGVVKGCCTAGERQILNNAIGVFLEGGELTLQGATRIEGNGAGVFMFGGQASLRSGVRLLSNGTGVINVSGFVWLNGAEIADSSRDGLAMADNASGRVSNATIANSGDNGIDLAALSTIRLFDSAVVRDSGGRDLVCEDGSLVRGELGGVGSTNCRRVSQGPQ